MFRFSSSHFPPPRISGHKSLDANLLAESARGTRVNMMSPAEGRSRSRATRAAASDDRGRAGWSSWLLPRVRVERVVHGEFTIQPFLVRDTEHRKSFRHGTEPATFRRHVLLPFHIGRTDNPAEAFETGIRQLEILQNRLEGAALAPMIQLHLLKPRGIERCRVLAVGGRKQLSFRHEQKLRVGIDESLDQPGTRDSIDFDVFASDPTHSRSSVSASPPSASMFFRARPRRP